MKFIEQRNTKKGRQSFLSIVYFSSFITLTLRPIGVAFSGLVVNVLAIGP
jgi:hypothetical protein